MLRFLTRYITHAGESRKQHWDLAFNFDKDDPNNAELQPQSTIRGPYHILQALLVRFVPLCVAKITCQSVC